MAQYIKVKWGKSTLYFTPQEIRRVLERGKAILRAGTARKREEKRRKAYERKVERLLR